VLLLRKICVINQKGGVGKTTTAVNLAAGLSRENRSVLLIDLDPQGNVGTSLKTEIKKDVFDLLFNNADPFECIVKMGKNLDVIPSKETLTKAETLLQKMEDKHVLLRQILQKVEGKYDYIILDCPPSLGTLNQNAILYSDEAFIPVATDFLGYDALKKMIEAINDINSFYDHFCKVSKIIPTMFDKRNKLAKEVLNQMNSEHYGLVADPIRTCSKVRESPRSGKSVFRHAPKSRGAEDYSTLVRHVIYDEPSELYQNA
jgi:chromosome partitioning protein